MRRTEIVDMIRSILHKVAPNAQIILYGSEARGEARPDSDIDLLILVDEPQLTPEYEQEIIRPLYELEVKSGVISHVVYEKYHEKKEGKEYLR